MDSDANSVSAYDHTETDQSDSLYYTHLINREPDRRPCCCGRASKKTCCGGVVLLLVLLSGLFYALLPSISQASLDAVKLNFDRLTISSPSPTNLTAAVKGTLSSTPFEIYTQKMKVEVWYDEQPMGRLVLPAMHILPNTPTILNDSMEFDFDDEALFAKFNYDLVEQASVTWRLKGRLDLELHLMGAKLSVRQLDFDKHVTFPGLAALQNLKIVSADMTQSTATDIIIIMTAVIENPSIVDIDPVGSLSFDAFYEGERLGSVESDVINLQEGQNTVQLKALVKPDNPTSPTIADMLSRALNNETLTVTVNGTQSSIPLYTPGVRGLQITTDMTLANPPLIQSVIVNKGLIRLIPDDFEHVLLTLDVHVRINQPLGPDCLVGIASIALQVGIYMDGPEGQDGTLTVGYLQTDTLKVPSGDQPEFDVSIEGLLQITNPDHFSQFAAQLMKEEEVLVRLSGTSSVRAKTVIGELLLEKLKVDVGSVAMQGQQAFTKLNLTEDSIAVTGGDARGIQINANFVATNPSNIGIDLGQSSDLTLDLMYQGVVVGSIVSSHFMLLPGSSVGQYSVLLNCPSDPTLLRLVVSQFMNGQEVPLDVRASKHPSIYPYLAYALSLLFSKTTLKGQHDAFLLSATMHGGSVQPLKQIIPTTLDVDNHFQANISLVASDTPVLLTQDGRQVAILNHSWADAPLLLPANTTTTTIKLPFHYVLDLDTLISVFEGATGGVDLSMRGGNITIRFGQEGSPEGYWDQVVDYNQSGVITYFTLKKQ